MQTDWPHAEPSSTNTTFQSDIAPDIPILIDFILRHNTFTLNDKYYFQSNGTAMGIKIDPAYANIFMAYVKNSFLSSFPLKETVY